MTDNPQTTRKGFKHYFWQGIVRDAVWFALGCFVWGIVLKSFMYGGACYGF